MTRRDLLLLFLLGLAVPLVIAQFQSLPGYMDSDYYFGGGIQLARGNGFTEPYIWNYLSDPQGLPTPSHAYWLPLASIVAAAGMWLTGQTTFTAARFGFLLLAAFVPPLTARLASRFTSNKILALLSGLLACFPIYYAPFLPVPDNYAVYMLLGISFFFLLSSLNTDREAWKPNTVNWLPNTENWNFFLLGILSALASLARSDGLLWLGISFVVAVWYARRRVHMYASTQVTQHATRNIFSFFLHLSSFILFTLLGFFLLMSPWYARNLSVFGTIMAPGGSRALWLTSYNDTFAYPASQVTMQAWLSSGWSGILAVRLTALKLNLLNAFAAQGGIFLFPFIVAGIWSLRKDVRVRFALLAWSLLLVAMTIVFPFAGARGAFFHSGAFLQPMWWVLAPIGLDAAVNFVRERGLFDEHAHAIFRGSLVLIAALMTVVIFVMRVLPGWEREDGHYAGVESVLVQHGAPADAIVIARNPPGYNIVTGRPAIALPAGGIAPLLAVAERYNARYLVIEPEGTSEELLALYDNPDSYPSFRYLGESDGNRLYEILR